MEVGGAGCKWWSAGAAKKQVGQSLWQVSDERWQLRSRWSRAGCEEAGGAEPVARISCDGARSGWNKRGEERI